MGKTPPADQEIYKKGKFAREVKISFRNNLSGLIGLGTSTKVDYVFKQKVQEEKK